MSSITGIASSAVSYALASGQNVMLSLGGFKFMIATAAYQELQRTTSYRWGSQDRFGKAPARQYLGPGDDSIHLAGVIYPEHQTSARNRVASIIDNILQSKGSGNGWQQINNLRLLAETGPLLMTSGRGEVLGRWIIEEIDETQTVFAIAGVPRKIEFSLQLKKFDDGTGL